MRVARNPTNIRWPAAQRGGNDCDDDTLNLNIEASENVPRVMEILITLIRCV